MLDRNDSQWRWQPSWANDISMFNLKGLRIWSKRRADLWAKNRSVVLMILAQMVSSLMAVAAREIQTTHQGSQALSETQVGRIPKTARRSNASQTCKRFLHKRTSGRQILVPNAFNAGSLR